MSGDAETWVKLDHYPSPYPLPEGEVFHCVISVYLYNYVSLKTGLPLIFL